MSQLEDIFVRLGRCDVCCVSDALDQLGLPSAVTGLTPLTVRVRICGPVVTVKLEKGPAPAGAPPRHLCTAAIESAPPRSIVVIEQRTGVDAAGWGGLLSNAAVVRGISGAIVEGPARDIDEAAALKFPVYARSQTARTARGRVHEAETGSPINVGGITVRSTDWVVADSSGVAFIAAEDIERLLEVAERLRQREALMTKDILAGQPASRVMGEKYEHMLQRAPLEVLK